MCKIWKTKMEATEAIVALRNARKVLNEEEWKNLRKKFIQIALRSYTEAQIHFFEYLPEYER